MGGWQLVRHSWTTSTRNGSSRRQWAGPVKLADRTSQACWDTLGTRDPGRVAGTSCVRAEGDSRRNHQWPDGYAGGPAAVRVAIASLRGYKQVNKHGFEFRAQGDVGRTSQACRDT